jgi:signal peptidase I
VKAESQRKANAEATVTPQDPKTQKVTQKQRVWAEVVSWTWVILAFILIEGGVAQARVIPSGSMENTVLIGDHLIVSRVGYGAGLPFTSYNMKLWRDPQRQQIIVFRAPLPDQNFPDLIKRCIAIPGDRLKIVGGQVYVNGVRIDDPHATRRANSAELSWENFPARASDLPYMDVPEWRQELAKNTVNGEVVVPAGKYFMMGDNRDDSNDSRFWGFVPRENIIGTPVMIYMSIEAPGEVWEPGHMSDRFQTYLSALLHPSEIRWHRLFHFFGDDAPRAGGAS